MTESFEDYFKRTTLDLSSYNKKETKANTDHTPTPRVRTRLMLQTYLGSKLWREVELDRDYNLYSSSADTCLKFCVGNNFSKVMKNIVDDFSRKEIKSCHFNCLSKLNYGNQLVLQERNRHIRKERVQADYNELFAFEKKSQS